MPLSRILRV